MCLTTAKHFPNKYRGDRSTIMTKTSKTNICLFVTLADLGGGVRDARPPPWASKFFRFHAVFGKIWRVHAPPGGFTPPPSGKSWIRHCVMFSKESSSDTLIFLNWQIMFCYLINSFPGTFTLSQYEVAMCSLCYISDDISL